MPHIGNFPGPGYPNPLTIHNSAFMPTLDTVDWQYNRMFLRNRVVLDAQGFEAPVFLPQGARVKKLTLYGFRTSANASLYLYLYRHDREGNTVTMASITADWDEGAGSGYDDTITEPLIDNENYDYVLEATIHLDATVSDCRLTSAKINWS